MHRIVWQVVVIVWLVALHGAPYGVIAYSRGSWSGLLYVIGAGLSGPFAQAGLLGFYLIAGNGSEWQRRLSGGGGLLAITFALGIVSKDNSVVLLPSLAVSVLAAALAVALAIRLLGFGLYRPLWPPRFTLWEIGVWLLLAGIVFGAIRWLQEPGGNLFQWNYLLDETFLYLLLHGALAGVVITLCGLPVLAHRSTSRWLSVLLACIAAGLLPLLEIMAIYLYAADVSSPTWKDVRETFLFGLAISGLIVFFAWGTMIPLKLAFRSLANGKPDSEAAGPGEIAMPDKKIDDFQHLQ